VQGIGAALQLSEVGEVGDGELAEVRLLAALHAVKLSSSLEFTNRLEASRLRDGIENALLNSLEEIDDDLKPQLLEVRRLFLVDVQKRILTLPAFRVVDLGDTFPSVVAAHKVFGDHTKEGDIRQWNKVIHPMFTPSRVEVIG
jgi:prophage DNA circulation protein